MKQIIFFFGFVIALLTSCSSLNPPASLDDIIHGETEYVVKESTEETNVEFIGFKISDTFSDNDKWKENEAVKNLGKKLQDSALAIDNSKFYFGVYSFQELEAYKSEKRYVSFIEFDNFEYSTGVYGSLSNKEIIKLKVKANVYVYDTVNKRIIYSSNSPITIDKYNYYNGMRYFSSYEERHRIDNYYTVC